MSPNSISVGVVPWRDIIYFLSDIFLGVWQCISSLAIYFRPAKSINLACFVASWKGRMRVQRLKEVARNTRAHSRSRCLLEPALPGFVGSVRIVTTRMLAQILLQPETKIGHWEGPLHRRCSIKSCPYQ